MLQAERLREAGFFVNTLYTMDMGVIKEEIEDAIGNPIGLCYKPIFGSFDADKKPIKALHVEVNALNFHKSLKALSDRYGRTTSGFNDGRKVRFFPTFQHSKSEKTRGIIRQGIERQAFFAKHVQRGYCSDFLFLDTKPSTTSELKTLRQMIAEIKSVQFPNLRLIHSVDATWKKQRYLGEFVYLTMPHLADEAALMMDNLIPFLRHKYWG